MKIWKTYNPFQYFSDILDHRRELPFIHSETHAGMHTIGYISMSKPKDIFGSDSLWDWENNRISLIFRMNGAILGIQPSNKGSKEHQVHHFHKSNKRVSKVLGDWRSYESMDAHR